MATTHQGRAAKATSQPAPIRLFETRPCWGRMGDGQCDACTLLTEPSADNLSSFPRLDVLVPDLVVLHIEGQDRTVCRNRRTGSAHRPAAVCEAVAGSVGALAHGLHAATVGAPLAQGNPQAHGGLA
jgi:hypothetical protein